MFFVLFEDLMEIVKLCVLFECYVFKEFVVNGDIDWEVNLVVVYYKLYVMEK